MAQTRVEDKGAGPNAMASLRNLALTALRFAGARNIAAATRYCSRRLESTARLLGADLAA